MFVNIYLWCIVVAGHVLLLAYIFSF